jgi:hypothetical protein
MYGESPDQRLAAAGEVWVRLAQGVGRHVQSTDGEAKFWLEPNIELARAHGLSDIDLRRLEQLVIEHEQEIRNAWNSHFAS